MDINLVVGIFMTLALLCSLIGIMRILLDNTVAGNYIGISLILTSLFIVVVVKYFLL